MALLFFNVVDMDFIDEAVFSLGCYLRLGSVRFVGAPLGYEFTALVEEMAADAVDDYVDQLEHDSIESFKMKEKLNELKFNQKRILLRVGDELFRVMTDVTERNLRNMRQSNFRPEHILPDNFFLNPVLYTDDMADDLCLLEAYVLMGQRSEDPDHYQKILSLMYDLLEKNHIAVPEKIAEG